MKFTLPTAASILLTTTLAAPSQLLSRGACPPDSDFSARTISPYMLVPISKSNPDKAYGGVPTGVVTPNDLCTIVDLKIPDSIDGELTLLKTCTLSLALPTSEQASPHEVEFEGEGHFTFTGYLTGDGANEKTTYNKQPLPGPSPPFPPDVITPGKTYTIAELPCGILPNSGGQTVSGALCSKDTRLKWGQTGPKVDSGCPVGFFVVVN